MRLCQTPRAVGSTDRSPTTKRRRWLKWVGAGAVLLALTLLALPLWWPWVLVPLAQREGVTVGSYHRDGSARLELRSVGFSNATTMVFAEQVTVQLPHRWLCDRLGWFGHDEGPQADLKSWRVQFRSSAHTNQPPDASSLAILLDQLGSAISAAQPWVRRLEAEDGELVYPGRTTRVERITILPESIVARVNDPISPTPGALSLRFPRPRFFELQLAVPGHEFGASLVLQPDGGDWRLDGVANWRTNVAGITGRIGTNGWLPHALNLTGADWSVPAGVLGLEGYGDVTGGFSAGWTNGHYQFAAEASARPTSELPIMRDRIQLDIAGKGDLDMLAIDRLTIATPVIKARLVEPVAVDFAGHLLGPEATLEVDADFTAESGLPFTGRLEGTVTARPGAAKMVNAGFALQVNRFASEFLQVERLSLEGALNWPQLIVSNANFTFPDAGTFRLSGELDLRELISTNVNWSFDGIVPGDYLPAEAKIAEVAAWGRLSGGWPNLVHHTDVLGLRPEWQGSRADLVAATVQGEVAGTNRWSLRLRQGELTLAGSGSIDLKALPQSSVTASFDELRATLTTNVSLSLAQPASLEASWQTNSARQFGLQISPVKLAGGGRQFELSADVEWPASGRLNLAVTNLTTADLAGLWVERPPHVAVRELSLTAGWNGGPLVFSSVADLEWEHPWTGPVTGRVRARGNAEGIELAPVTAGVADGEFLNLTGRIPLQIRPGTATWVQWLDDGVFDAQLQSVAGTTFWSRLAGQMGLELVEPRFEGRVGGRFADFRAQLDFNARSVGSQLLTNLPPGVAVISNLQFQAGADRQSIRLHKGTFTVAGQAGGFSGELPLTAGNWSDWWRELQRLDWRKAHGEVTIPAIDMATLSPLTGKALTSAGQAAVELRLLSGGGLRGFVTASNLVTRPIEPLGSLRDISGRIEFDNQRAELASFHATLNGQPLRGGGSATWDGSGLTAANAFLKATNLSLARSVDLFLRGDLDLRLTTDGRTAPTIGGEVLLSNSLLFQDFAELVAIDLKRPERRPPFFSVAAPPFGDWRLDVRVRGQKFLRVLSPVFKGQVSSALQLSGTLREPVALGEITIDKGQMIFPFGSLEVTRGVVQLSRQNPHQPRVDFRGQGLNFGYNLTVDVTGGADAPNINFSSVPPLTTREIMLMLTAGEIPSGAYSYTDVDKASKLGYFLGKELINQLLGFDPGEDKLLFRTGEYVTDDGQLTYRVEYKLIDWLSVFGEYTRFRDYNGGLKFNLYSR